MSESATLEEMGWTSQSLAMDELDEQVLQNVGDTNSFQVQAEKTRKVAAMARALAYRVYIDLFLSEASFLLAHQGAGHLQMFSGWGSEIQSDDASTTFGHAEYFFLKLNLEEDPPKAAMSSDFGDLIFTPMVIKANLRNEVTGDSGLPQAVIESLLGELVRNIKTHIPEAQNVVRFILSSGSNCYLGAVDLKKRVHFFGKRIAFEHKPEDLPDEEGRKKERRTILAYIKDWIRTCDKGDPLSSKFVHPTQTRGF